MIFFICSHTARRIGNMNTKLVKSVAFGWIVTIFGIIWPILAFLYPDQMAPQFMWQHIPNLFFISILLLVLRYSVYGPILNTAKNAAKITMLAIIFDFFATRRTTERFNPFIIGLVLGCVIIMAFQIMYLVIVCWYYLIRETIALIKTSKNSQATIS